MPGLYKLLAEIHDDRKITDAEVEVIREYIHADGKLDLADVKFLVELLSDAREVSPAFDELFFPALKRVILQDGKIDEGERFYLLKMLYADGNVRESEKRFLLELKREAKEVPSEFDAMVKTAMEADAKDWCVGGSPAAGKGKRKRPF